MGIQDNPISKIKGKLGIWVAASQPASQRSNPQKIGKLGFFSKSPMGIQDNPIFRMKDKLGIWVAWSLIHMSLDL